MGRFLEINSCTECPFCDTNRDYSADSFETLIRWDCKKKQQASRRYVEWTDKENFIPDWCPLPQATQLVSSSKLWA